MVIHAMFGNGCKRVYPKLRGSGYYNFARSGFGTDKVLAVGPDACGTVYRSPGPIADAKSIVQAHRGSWTGVVVTAGIDDTNWIERLDDVAEHSFVRPYPLYTTADCSKDLSAWSGFDAQVQASISKNIANIVTDLQAADHGVFITWRGYYTRSHWPCDWTAERRTCSAGLLETCPEGRKHYQLHRSVCVPALRADLCVTSIVTG